MHDIIALHLFDMRGEWVPSYSLTKVNTKYGWLGSSGDRRARELAEIGNHIVNGTTYFIERRKQGKYAEYRATGMTKNIERVEIIENEDGTRIAKLIKETINI